MTISAPPELSGTTPALPPAIEAADTAVSTSTSRIAADESAVRDFLRGLAQLQGQLPATIEDKQQALLRQLSSLLTTNNIANNAAPGMTTPQSELFIRIINQLPASDSFPRQLINQLVASLSPTTSSTPDPVILTSALSKLPAFINSTSEQGKVFWNWCSQLAALRLPFPADINLQKQLQQQAVRLISSDSRTLPPAIQSATELTIKFLGKLTENTTIKLSNLPIPNRTEINNSPDTSTNKTDRPLLTTPSTSANLSANIIAPSSQTMSDLSPSHAQRSVLDTTKNISTELNKQTPSGLTAANSNSVPPEHESQIAPLNTIVKTLSTPTLPLGDYLHTLSNLLEKKILPATLQTPLRQLITALSPQIHSASQVREWVNFIQNPLLGDTPNSKSLQQWALSLLSYHLLRAAPAESNADGKSGVQQATHRLLSEIEEPQTTLNKPAAQFIQQMEKLQSPLQENNTLLLLNIPLPPQYPGGKENYVRCQQGRNEQGKYHWTLTFMLDLEHLGALQVKAMLDTPDITLQMTAEKLQTCDLIKSTWPSLDARLRELGLTPGPLLCKQGKIKADADRDGNNPEGLSIRV